MELEILNGIPPAKKINGCSLDLAKAVHVMVKLNVFAMPDLASPCIKHAPNDDALLASLHPYRGIQSSSQVQKQKTNQRPALIQSS